MKITYRIIIFLIAITVFGCSQKPPPPILEYNGPLKEAADVDMLYAEKDRVKVRMQAKKILEFKNNDQEFPEGVFIQFYDEFGNLTSTLKANHAFYFKEQDLWRGRGKVEVVNIEKKQQLNSEELFWKRVEKKIYTEKFVTIKLENEILYGTGLDAAQDLSYYTIKKPNGVFEVKD